MYADDGVILALSWVAQHTLLKMCCSWVNVLDLKFNNVAECVFLMFLLLEISCLFSNFTSAGFTVNTDADIVNIYCRILLLFVTDNSYNEMTCLTI